jgi:hypothetical protein
MLSAVSVPAAATAPVPVPLSPLTVCFPFLLLLRPLLRCIPTLPSGAARVLLLLPLLLLPWPLPSLLLLLLLLLLYLAALLLHSRASMLLLLPVCSCSILCASCSTHCCRCSGSAREHRLLVSAWVASNSPAVVHECVGPWAGLFLEVWVAQRCFC